MKSHTHLLHIGLILFGLLPAARAASFSFYPLTRTSNGAVVLRLQGDAGTNYVVEASQHLGYWFPVASGAPINGSFDFVHDATNFPALFYRARLFDATPPPRLTPKVDTNWTASGLVTVEGGSCVLFTSGRVIYRLTVPPRTLRDPTFVTMTLVTNIVEWPFTNSVDAVIQLSPDGLALAGAATLEIQFPTNLPMSGISSYTFQGDGNGVHLLADRQQSNTVTIPVTHFSFLGAATLPQSQSAAAVGDSLNGTVDAISTRMAGQLKANPSLANDPNFWTDVRSDYDQFARENLKPLLPQLTNNCSLAEAVTTLGARLDGQFQVLGIQGAAGGQSFLPELDDLRCGIFENCKKELVDECRRIGGRGSIATALTQLNRQGAILGVSGNCGGSDFMKEIKPCAPLWSGSIEYSEKGMTNVSTPNSYAELERSFRIYGYVEDATEVSLGGILFLTLNVACFYEGRETHDSIATSVNTYLDHMEIGFSGSRTNVLSFALLPGVPPGFTIEYAEVPQWTIMSGVHCTIDDPGKCVTFNDSTLGSYTPGGLSRNGVEETGWTTNRFSGTMKTNTFNGMPVTREFKWTFERNDQYQPPTP